MAELAYDPARVALLRARAVAALQHLGRAAADDSAAASALRVAARVRAGIENEWLPVIDRVLASVAMLTWTTTAPAWVQGRRGAALGRALAARARALARDTRVETVEAMLAALRHASSDDAAMRALFRELGPDGLLELLSALATTDTTSTALPEALRAAFVRTCAAGGLRHGFARGLVDAAAEAHVRSGRDGAHALTFAYLLRGGQLPTTFLVDTARALVAAERRFAGQQGLQPDHGWSLWTVSVRPPHALAPELADPSGLLAPAAGDPMYALLAQLARDGRAGRVVFGDHDRAAYLFGGRDVLADGGAAIVAAAATAAAGDDVGPGASPRTLAQASLVASGFVNHFGRANATRASGEVTALAAARIVGTHLYAADVALAAPGVTDDERLGALDPADRRALEEAGTLTADGAPPVTGVVALPHDVLGPDDPRPAALLQQEPLGHVLDLAVSTDMSAQLLRGALATYQRGLASAAAARLAAGEIARPDRYLAEVTADAARLDARIGQRVGHQAERRGRGADAALTFWIRAIGDGGGRLGELLGRPGAAVVRAVAAPVTDAATSALADAEREAAADADGRARLASEQLAYVWARELHNAGVIDARLPAELAPGGVLPAYGELVRRVVAHPDWTMERVLRALDVAPSRVGVELDIEALRDAMATAQLPAYRELD